MKRDSNRNDRKQKIKLKINSRVFKGFFEIFVKFQGFPGFSRF